MNIRRFVIFFALVFIVFKGSELFAINQPHVPLGDVGKSAIPMPLDSYGDSDVESLWSVLKNRVEKEPLNLVVTIIFLCAIVHTFIARKFLKLAHKYEKKHEEWMKHYGGVQAPDDMVCYKAEVFHFLGEIEAVFGLWVIPLIFSVMYFYDWQTMVNYMNYKVNYLEPVFVVVIMAIAGTRPVLKMAESCLRVAAKIGKCSPAAWWFSILMIGPLLGSFITEPAAMTICALLLGKQFYKLKPSKNFSYATLGLLFVNISVGGTLTHFAAPPVLMVAGTWDWDIMFMLENFGWKSFSAILVGNLVYFFIFKSEFARLKAQVQHEIDTRRELVADEEVKKEFPIPWVVTVSHLIFLAWTVMNLHNLPLFIGGFLFFLAFTQITLHHQYQFSIRTPMLVGFFLAGLVTHGGLQQWWIEPVLSRLSEVPLFIGSAALTAFNDNAAITYLAQLVPSFADNVSLQKAVVMGAVAGGGLTVIANAPNPAGQSILNKYFDGGINPLKLLLGALTPTFIVCACYMFFP